MPAALWWHICLVLRCWVMPNQSQQYNAELSNRIARGTSSFGQSKWKVGWHCQEMRGNCRGNLCPQGFWEFLCIWESAERIINILRHSRFLKVWTVPMFYHPEMLLNVNGNLFLHGPFHHTPNPLNKSLVPTHFPILVNPLLSAITHSVFGTGNRIYWQVWLLNCPVHASSYRSGSNTVYMH